MTSLDVAARMDRLQVLLASVRAQSPSDYNSGYIEALETAIAVMGGDAWPPCGDCGHERRQHSGDLSCSGIMAVLGGPCPCIAYHPWHGHES